MLTLYVWLRSDLASMNTGKACAQVAHAASQAAALIYRGKINSDQVRESYHDWEDAAQSEARKDSKYPITAFQGFGTTIVLDGGTLEQMLNTYNDHILTQAKQYHEHASRFLHGMVVDPSYPVRDGKFTHYIETPTCLWLFGDKDDSTVKAMTESYSLHK